jgi:hypothetical protein
MYIGGWPTFKRHDAFIDHLDPDLPVTWPTASRDRSRPHQ